MAMNSLFRTSTLASRDELALDIMILPLYRRHALPGASQRTQAAYRKEAPEPCQVQKLIHNIRMIAAEARTPRARKAKFSQIHRDGSAATAVDSRERRCVETIGACI